MTKNENIRFLLKVTVAHMVTYFICGAFFSTILNYEELFQSSGGILRDYGSIWITLGPLLQVFRGLLFGGILLLIPKEFYKQKHAWLKLWIVVAGIGIINTPGPGGGSIEGMIYTTAPWQSHTIYCIEIYLQTLWFSWWVCRQKEDKRNSPMARFKLPLACAGITVLCTSAFGVIVSAIQGTDPASGGQDPSAMIALLLMAVMIFLAVFWYRQKPDRSVIVFICACYLINALPTMSYNFILDTSFRSFDSLFTAIVPTFFIWLILRPKRSELMNY
jgi:hypothetical protein